MSDLTPCNHCSLRHIEYMAEARGATVAIRHMTHRDGEMVGWYEVTVSDEPEPVAFFMELTHGCAC